MKVQLLIGALGGPLELRGTLNDPLALRPKMAKIDHKSKKIENHNRINNQGPFFGTRSGGKVSLEVKLLLGALGGPSRITRHP